MAIPPDQLPNGFTGFSHLKQKRTVSDSSQARGEKPFDESGTRELSHAMYPDSPLVDSSTPISNRASFLGSSARTHSEENAVSSWGAPETAASSRRQHERAVGGAYEGLRRFIRGGDTRDGVTHDSATRDGATNVGQLVEFDPEKLSCIPEVDRRWAWTEIDLNAFRNNITTLRNSLANRARMMAVVKADAYGHGAVRCAKTALNSGADYLGVATVDEAIALREAMVNAPVLILSEPPLEAIPLLLAYKVMPCIYTAEFAIAYGEAADSLDLRAPYHLAVNTGMNRIGVRYDDVVEFLSQIDFHRALELVGTMTHFATADAPETLDFNLQTRRFVEAIKAMRLAGFNPGIVHAANSAAIIRYPEVHFDMVRGGIALYGLHPSPETRMLVNLQPVMSVHARITDVRQLAMSEGVSYGLHYRSPGSVKIATIPLGYADGLRRGLSGQIDFIYQGQRVRQVGTICMDQSMFEVDMRTYANRKRLDPQIGDEVIVVGREGDSVITMDDLAFTLDTITHEIAIGFGNLRIPRVYV